MTADGKGLDEGIGRFAGGESLAALRTELEERRLDGYVTFDPDHQTYLTGFRALLYSRPIALLVTPEEAVLVVPELEETHSSAFAAVDRVLAYLERPAAGAPASPSALLAPLLSDLGPGARLGVDADHLPLGRADELRRAGCELVRCDGMVAGLRAVKRADELKAIGVAAELTIAGLRASLDVAASGVSELEVDAAGDTAIYRGASDFGAETGLGLLVMTASGPERSILPHVFSTTRRLVRGDVVIHSRQVAFAGYRAELERTFMVGPPSSEQAVAFAAMLEAQQAAIDAVAAGVPMAVVDAAAREVIERAGFGPHAIHRTGHGIGVGVHEWPFLRFDANEPLREGMVVTIEPGFYVPGLGGFRHSDTLIVEAGGSTILTGFPRTFEELMVS